LYRDIGIVKSLLVRIFCKFGIYAAPIHALMSILCFTVVQWFPGPECQEVIVSSD